MPTYDYECQACGHTFEVFQSIKASAIRKCPACSEMKVRRLIGTGGALLFKGSGFYVTDYRSDSYKQKAKSDKPTESTGAADKSNKFSDSKAGGDKKD